MGNIVKVMGDLKPAFVMILVQVAYTVTTISYRLVSLSDKGTSFSVLVAYRFLFASAFILPLAFFVERKRKPKITGVVLFEAFLCGLFGATLQINLFMEAVALAGATYATAMSNLAPGVTFILAIFFGLEKMNAATLTGKAKVVGTVMGIGGAMMMTFYKSKEIHLWSTHFNLMKVHMAPRNASTNQIWGCALGFVSCLSNSLWLIIRARMNEKFPWHYTSTALMCVMASIQSVIFAVFMEGDWKHWKLGWDIRLLTVAYTGIVASGVVWVVVSWCVSLKGPLYVSIFNPFYLVLVTIIASLILDETLHLGSIIGFILIVMGLYVVLWGKGKELKKIADEQNVAKGSVEGDSLKITTLASLFSTSDVLSIKQKEGSRKGTESNDTSENIPNDASQTQKPSA